MTNDLFKDHLKKFELTNNSKNNEVVKLFRMWYESSNIRFSKLQTTVRVKFCIF